MKNPIPGAGSALLDVHDLSAIMRVSVSTIYRRRSLGEPLPPAIRLGGNAVRWRQQDVENWLEERLERL